MWMFLMMEQYESSIQTDSPKKSNRNDLGNQKNSERFEKLITKKKNGMEYTINVRQWHYESSGKEITFTKTNGSRLEMFMNKLLFVIILIKQGYCFCNSNDVNTLFQVYLQSKEASQIKLLDKLFLNVPNISLNGAKEFQGNYNEQIAEAEEKVEEKLRKEEDDGLDEWKEGDRIKMRSRKKKNFTTT